MVPVCPQALAWYTRRRWRTTSSVSSDRVVMNCAHCAGGLSGGMRTSACPPVAGRQMSATFQFFPHLEHNRRPRHFSIKTSSLRKAGGDAGRRVAARREQAVATAGQQVEHPQPPGIAGRGAPQREIQRERNGQRRFQGARLPDGPREPIQKESPLPIALARLQALLRADRVSNVTFIIGGDIQSARQRAEAPAGRSGPSSHPSVT